MHIQKMNILGVNVSAIDMEQAVKAIYSWVRHREQNYVCIRDVHGIIHCQDDEEYRRIHDYAGMVTPDGMPIVWMAHWLGFKQVKRVSGPDLMASVFEHSAENGYSHYFYGGEQSVVERLIDSVGIRYPGLQIAGYESPPFRPLTAKEDAAALQRINKTGADVLWVGLGTPRQEKWMADRVAELNVPVIIGVGAAFNFLIGEVARAPVWMQKTGLEWLFRLASEPQRLWRRYLLVTPRFIPLAVMQLTGLRTFSSLVPDKPGKD